MRVLSLNTALLSAFFGNIDIQPNVEERAPVIARTILCMDDEPDVICLQEVFDYDAIMHIKSQLNTIYPYDYIDERIPAWFVGVDSGLAIFSKYPITQRFIYTYKYCTGDCILSKKGVMGVKVDVNGKEICVFNTHMQAGPNKSYLFKFLYLFCKNQINGINVRRLSTNQVRMMQLREAKTHIELFAGDTPSIFVGDFNIDSYDQTYFKDPLDNEEITVANMINKVFPHTETYRRDMSASIYSIYDDNKRIDHMLAVQGIEGMSYIVDTFTEKMTDHRGVYGAFYV